MKTDWPQASRVKKMLALADPGPEGLASAEIR